MASKGIQEVRAYLQEMVGSQDTIEAEQVLDSMFKKNVERDVYGNKSKGINALENKLGERWEEEALAVIDNMLGRYQNDKLPLIALKDCGESVTQGKLDAIAEELKRRGVYTEKCSEGYLQALLYHKMEKPKLTKEHYGATGDLIRASFLAAISNGAGYLVMSYPPQIFLDEVLRIDEVTRESYYTTIVKSMESVFSFLHLCLTAAELNQDDFKEMCEDYKNLINSQSTGMEISTHVEVAEDEPEVVETEELPPPKQKMQDAEYTEVKGKKKKSGGFLKLFKGLGAGMVGLIASVFGNREKHKKTLTTAANKWANSSKKITSKAGKKMILLWRIITGVNVVALLMKGVSLILTFFVDVTGRKTEAVASKVSKIPLVGGLFKATTKAVSASAIRSRLIFSSIPWLIALGVLAVFSLRVLKRKQDGEQDNIFQMLISLIVIVATTISVILIIKFGYALFMAFQDMEYFWATFYDNL